MKTTKLKCGRPFETGVKPNPHFCKTCMNRSSFIRGKIYDRAESEYCKVFQQPIHKPEKVFWDGGCCEEYEYAGNKPDSLLLGLAVGEAIGVPFLLKKRGSFLAADMVTNESQLPIGTWSDGTSMALALADALQPTSLNLRGQASRLLHWTDRGDFTPYGRPLGMDDRIRKVREALKGRMNSMEAGGPCLLDEGSVSLIRIAPLVFFYMTKEPEERFELTRQASSVTQADPVSVIACFIYLEFLHNLFWWKDKNFAYELLQKEVQHYLFLKSKELDNFERILVGDIRTLEESEIKSSTFVGDTLEVAMWSFLTTDSYRDGVLRAVNLGDNTSTAGAVTGAIAGLFYGTEGIPIRWLDKLAKRENIREIARKMPRWINLPCKVDFAEV